jgi:hypothetical protein
MTTLVMSSRRPKDTDSAPILPTPTPHHSPGETTSSRARDPMRPYVEPNAGAIDTPWRTPYRAPADHDTGLLGSTPSDAARGRTRQPEIGWWGALGRSRGAVGPRGGGRADRLVGGRRSLQIGRASSPPSPPRLPLERLFGRSRARRRWTRCWRLVLSARGSCGRSTSPAAARRSERARRRAWIAAGSGSQQEEGRNGSSWALCRLRSTGRPGRG